MSDNVPAPLVSSPAALVADMGTVYTSLDCRTDDGKRAFLRALGDTDFRAEDVKGGTFEIANFICHRVTVEKDDGEIIEATRTVLIAPGGETLGFTSIGVRTSLAALISLYGVPPWSPARKVEIQESQTRKGRRLYRIIPA